MLVQDLNLIPYRDAWALQESAHAQALAGGEETLFLLEHTPVITFGRRAADSAKNLRASADYLQSLGVEIVESDRGGDITFHGPGQLVAYPILRLADRHLSVGGYVHTLEDILINTLSEFGVNASKDPSAPGVWVNPALPTNAPNLSAPFAPLAETPSNSLALSRFDSNDSAAETSPSAPESSPLPHCNMCVLSKIAALGVRIRRGVSLHGIALNLTTDLAYFNLINPCGLSRPVTTLQTLLGDQTPDMPTLKAALARHMLARFH